MSGPHEGPLLLSCVQSALVQVSDSFLISLLGRFEESHIKNAPVRHVAVICVANCPNGGVTFWHQHKWTAKINRWVKMSALVNIGSRMGLEPHLQQNKQILHKIITKNPKQLHPTFIYRHKDQT